MDGENQNLNAGADAGAVETGGAELSSAERAMDFWEKGDAAPSADSVAAKPENNGNEGAAANQNGDDGRKPEDQGEPGADKPGADGKPAPLSDEQLQADPRYQELATFRDEMQPLLDKHGVTDSKELGLQLADSQILYDIASGKGMPSQLLDVMIQNTGWTRDQVATVANDLKGWLTKNGFLKADEAGAGAQGQQPGFKDPLAERLDKFEQDQKAERERTQREATQRATEERQTKVFTTFTSEVERLAAAAGVHKEDFGGYGREIRAALPAAGTPEFNAVVSRIEKNNFVDIKKAFDTVHNKEVARLKRYNGTMIKNAERRENAAPRVPAAGGTPATGAGKPQRDLRSSEGRQAAALDEWNK